MTTGWGTAFDISGNLPPHWLGGAARTCCDHTETVERRKVVNVTSAPRLCGAGLRKWRALCRPEMYEETSAAPGTSSSCGVAASEQRKVNESGAELGYRVRRPPIIDKPSGGPEHLYRGIGPQHARRRLPHGWLAMVRIHDHSLPQLHAGRLNPTQDIAPLWRHSRLSAHRLTRTRCRGNPARAYERDLLLLRPEMHVVWRGKQLPGILTSSSR